MVIEMPGDERDINVAGLADRLPVIECFEHREEAFALLDVPGNRVEITRTGMAGQCGPCREGRRGGADGGVDITSGAFGDVGKRFIACGVHDAKRAAFRRLHKGATNIVTKAVPMVFEPFPHGRFGFRSRAILHCVQNFFDGGHWCYPQASAWWEADA